MIKSLPSRSRPTQTIDHQYFTNSIPRKLINDGLETNWLLLTQLDPKLVEPFRVEQPGAGGVYKAVVKAPQVMVETGFAEDLSGIVYLMNFESGSFIVSDEIPRENLRC